MSIMLASAERWLAQGIAPIPILSRDKRPARPWAQFQKALPTYQDLLDWFGGDSDLNLAMVCGWKNVVTLDFDARWAWCNWLDWLEDARPAIALEAPDARQTSTARGRHLYAHLAKPVRSRPLRALGIDIKAAGGYVLVPPSIHPSGARYRAVNPGARILSCEALSDLLPAEVLVETEIRDPDPSSSVRITLPDLAAVASADPWEAAAHATEFDRARGLARIKSAFRVEEWFPQRQRSSSDGRWWLARCPFHDDQHPSFWIDTTRQLCGCHAGCTPKPLDVIDLFARICSLSNDEAIRMLSRAAGS